MEESLPYIKRINQHNTASESIESRLFRVTGAALLFENITAHRSWSKGDRVTFRYADNPTHLLSDTGFFRVRIAEVSFQELDGKLWPSNDRGYDYLLTGNEPSEIFIPAGWHYAVVAMDAYDNYVRITRFEERMAGRTWCPMDQREINAEDLQWDYGWAD